MKLFNYLFFVCLLRGLSSQATVRLPHVIGDGMVLQQQAHARLWGWCDNSASLQITTSWSERIYQAHVNGEGRWSVEIETPEAGFIRQSITIDDGRAPVQIKDVLIGEVWICAGQSNMKMPMKGFDSNPIEGYNQAILDAVHDQHIHYIEVPRQMSAKPLDDAPCQWQTVTPQSVGDCSAVGYYFARQLSQTLNIPIGLILANQGGTRVEAWMNEAYLKRYTQESTDSATIVRNQSNAGRRQLLWYNGTFHPVIGYTVKGFLFYQGCSNVGDAGDQYSERLSLLVKQWRSEFGQGDLPFYMVEIAPFATKDMQGIQSALLREQQYKASTTIPNCVMVGTNDLVYPWERNNIHPCQKRPIGERLAYTALHRDYGMKAIHYRHPVYRSLSVKEDTCYVELDYELGMDHYEDIEGFEVAGSDRQFHPATAKFDRKIRSVILHSPEVKKPVAVRYCFRNFQIGNFKNQVGLPLIPFRTDQW